MAITAKHRRKIVIAGRIYAWYVWHDDDSSDQVLSILSEDKRFIVKFHLGQPNDRAFLIVLGPEFEGVENTGRTWRRFRCPQWDDKTAITPATVRRIVEWSLSPKSSLTEVDCYGVPVPLGGFCDSCGYNLLGNIGRAVCDCPRCGYKIVERQER